MSAKEFLKATQPYIYTTDAAKLLDISAPISSSFLSDLESDVNLGTNTDADIVRYDTEEANRISTFNSASDPSFGTPNTSFTSPISNHTESRPTNIHTLLSTSSAETITIGPLTIHILEDGSHTSNRLSAVLITLPPKSAGPPMHCHQEHDEGFLITKGRVRFSTRLYLDLGVADTVSASLEGAKTREVSAQAAPETKENLRMVEELLHLGARPISTESSLRNRPKAEEMADKVDDEGIPNDIDISPGGWVTVPVGANYTFSNPFEEEAGMVNMFTTGAYIDYLRQISKECEGGAVGKERDAETTSGFGTRLV